MADTITKDDFIRAYAARSGLTPEQLLALGRDAFPCDCGDAICEGWQMRNAQEYAEDSREDKSNG
jgi:hypothetical protein